MNKKGERKVFILIFVNNKSDIKFFDLLIGYILEYYECNTIEFFVKQVRKNTGIINLKSSFNQCKNKIKEQSDIICIYAYNELDLNGIHGGDIRQAKKQITELKKKCSAFYSYKITNSIERWFLKDLESICEYLSIEGRKVEDKIVNECEFLDELFKLGDKIYNHGNTDEFIRELNISKIFQEIKSEIQPILKKITSCLK